MCVYVCQVGEQQKKESWSSPPLLHLAELAWAAINFHANHKGFGMNSGTIFKLCARVRVCSRLCVCASPFFFFFFFAGTSRDKAPSARSRLSWLPASLAGAGERLSVSIVTKRTLPPLFLLHCLLMLTANNVLLDGCALLEPESRDWD